MSYPTALAVRLSAAVRGLRALAWFVLGMPRDAAQIVKSGLNRAEAQALMRRRAERILEFSGIDVVLEGPDRLPSGGYVGVYNETSWPDAWAQHAVLWGVHFDRGAAAYEYGFLPYMKRAATVLGLALVPRGDRTGTERVLAQLTAALRGGERVLFGGEGQMSGIDGVRRFKRGGALLAIRSGRPLVPIAFHGGQRLMPWGGLAIKSGTVQVRIGEPIPVAGLQDDDARELADRAQMAVAKLYDGASRA